MGLDRRTFLQQAGLTWLTYGATLNGMTTGVGNNRLATLIQNYQQNLSTPTNRKLALLVGINRYPHHNPLEGCLTDVEMQRELLIHRFGFNPEDILTISDRQATRENIETAFTDHLIGQAQADDVVVFHFSGYGGQIKIPLTTQINQEQDSNIEDFKLVNSFIPVDGVLNESKLAIANGILQETLLVLAQSLSTSKCTFILDTSFNTTAGSLHSSLKIRSLPEVADINPEELAFVAQLQADLAAKGLKASKILSLPGIVLSACSNNQVAAERHWHGFSAGLFTQALTQHLWQNTLPTTVQTVIVESAATVQQIMGRQQQPTMGSLEKSTPAYYLDTNDLTVAVGVISKINNNGSIEIKLLGLPANIINSYGVNSCLSLVDSELRDNAPQLQVKSKEGFSVKTQLLPLPNQNSPQVGQLVREKIRILDPNLRLTLALDADLQRIERVDATSAIANIPAINSAIVSGEHDADCLLGKVHQEQNSDTVSSVALSDTTALNYGLYTAGGVLIGQTTGTEKAVKVALERLEPEFNNLLAAKWLNLTCNEFSSKLKVNGTLDAATASSSNLPPVTLTRSTQASPPKKLLSLKEVDYNYNSVSTLPVLTKGSQIQLTLSNAEEEELYVILLGVDSDGKIFALYTPNLASNIEIEAQLNNLAIAGNSELIIPQADNSWQWKISQTAGINTLYAIFAIQPFAQTLKALASQQNAKLDQQQILNLVNPQQVLKAIMQDLHAASGVDSKLLPSNEVYALDVNCWATLSFVYEIANA
ncbi:peptidase C14 caspase catalytic subunit p20 [Chondrocystis sp. NIES-4102]|nr:peptidase C14 caspase catalytic subunit p20 [Chondrocystis sp. NIES-4102]